MRTPVLVFPHYLAACWLENFMITSQLRLTGLAFKVL